MVTNAYKCLVHNKKKKKKKKKKTAKIFAYPIPTNRLRTNQNLATQLDLAIVAKRSFKKLCIFHICFIKLKHCEKIVGKYSIKIVNNIQYFV